MTSIDFALETIDRKQVSLQQFPAKAYLIVNTASRCVYTTQYAGLEQLYQEFKDQGLQVLGFPCNQFGEQEPGDNQIIGEFCQRNYGVSFPMFSKIDVNGKQTHPLFQYLKQKAPGFLGSKSIKWNFTKFLVNVSDGSIKRYGPNTSPRAIRKEIAKALCKPRSTQANSLDLERQT